MERLVSSFRVANGERARTRSEPSKLLHKDMVC
jgi:hypothetical protein